MCQQLLFTSTKKTRLICDVRLMFYLVNIHCSVRTKISFCNGLVDVRMSKVRLYVTKPLPVHYQWLFDTLEDCVSAVVMLSIWRWRPRGRLAAVKILSHTNHWRHQREQSLLQIWLLICSWRPRLSRPRFAAHRYTPLLIRVNQPVESPPVSAKHVIWTPESAGNRVTELIKLKTGYQSAHTSSLLSSVVNTPWLADTDLVSDL